MSILRKGILNALQNAHIKYRSIVMGTFTQNKAIKYFDYEIFDELKNENIYKKWLFVGNHQVDIKKMALFTYPRVLNKFSS